MALTDKLTAIGDAIRAKKGATDKYTLEGMAVAIEGIETGVDTSDATAVAEDIVQGKTAYVNGEKVTGSRKKVTQLTGSVTSKAILNGFATLVGKVKQNAAIDAGKTIGLSLGLDELGDAIDADVAKGKTYTSVGGFKRTGTHEEAAGSSEEYEGDYRVIPKFTETVLQTKDKFMKDNVSVSPIEVARVSNPSGGTTVYIGGITNG